jgi:hypothetical protein
VVCIGRGWFTMKRRVYDGMSQLGVRIPTPKQPWACEMYIRHPECGDGMSRVGCAANLTTCRPQCQATNHSTITSLYQTNPKCSRVAARAQAIPSCSSLHYGCTNVQCYWRKSLGRAYAAAHRLGMCSASGTGGTEAKGSLMKEVSRLELADIQMQSR